jgi:hypothetical protein
MILPSYNTFAKIRESSRSPYIWGCRLLKNHHIWRFENTNLKLAKVLLLGEILNEMVSKKAQTDGISNLIFFNIGFHGKKYLLKLLQT